MATTPQEILTVARDILNDTDTADPRNSDAELLRYFNDGVREISQLRPDLFVTVGDYTCTPSQSEQKVSFLDAQELFSVVSIHGGNAVTPFDMATMDTFNPGWRAATVGAAEQWAKFPGDPLRFFVYPPAPVTQQILDVVYVRLPDPLGLTEVIVDVPARLFPALQDYLVYRASLKDDEHVNSGRAAGLFNSFVAKVKGGSQ